MKKKTQYLLGTILIIVLLVISCNKAEEWGNWPIYFFGIIAIFSGTLLASEITNHK